MSTARAGGDWSRGAGRGRPAPVRPAPTQEWTPSVNPWIIAASVMLATDRKSTRLNSSHNA